MTEIKLEKHISALRQETPALDPRIKGEVMAHVSANGFARKANPLFRYAVGFAALILFGASGTVLASQRAQPGQALYQVKRVSETAYVTMQPSYSARAYANEALIARRIAEARLSDRQAMAIGSDIDEELAIDARLALDLAHESDEWVNAQEGAFTRAIERLR
jgi:hypothetical protein